MSLKVPYFSSGCFKNLYVYCGVNNELQSYTGAYYPASCSNYIKPFLSKWKTLFISLINTYDSQYTTRKSHDRMSAMKFSIKKKQQQKNQTLPACQVNISKLRPEKLFINFFVGLIHFVA